MPARQATRRAKNPAISRRPSPTASRLAAKTQPRISIMRFVYSMLCLLLVAAAPLHAENLQPNQVVQNLVDDLAKTMETRRDELSKNREALLKTIDGIVLPHFDIDYA